MTNIHKCLSAVWGSSLYEYKDPTDKSIWQVSLQSWMFLNKIRSANMALLSTQNDIFTFEEYSEYNWPMLKNALSNNYYDMQLSWVNVSLRTHKIFHREEFFGAINIPRWKLEVSDSRNLFGMWHFNVDWVSLKGEGCWPPWQMLISCFENMF